MYIHGIICVPVSQIIESMLYVYYNVTYIYKAHIIMY